jgi:hypothetical protein
VPRPHQLPPEVIQYIQQLEKQVAQSQGSNNSDSSSEGSDSSNDSTDSDNSNKPFGKSGAFNMNEDIFLDELSKAIRDEDGRADFSKALQARFDAYESEISKAQELAASERDLRLEREFIAKAAEFSVPVAADELGPVLKRAAENLSSEDFKRHRQVPADAATETTALNVFGEVGKRGGGDNVDILRRRRGRGWRELAASRQHHPGAATLRSSRTTRRRTTSTCATTRPTGFWSPPG